ncbi:alpha-E domain-containing protein [Mangrovicoccus algicola]|uniref:Alpha-E domain-containing protein n=1 Tax=Mangrovicoccus algicola TaxID=2771008 RepID=A0A8J7D0G7_9RHOB|nr:alpha-E domain-containing protein [Mangrovicoccus algicola]MBE3639418.1 alpha-E domain-containing protein [Mangrovicoccus algicola]
MLSRTAENLYWMARYLERAETMARLVELGTRMRLMPDAVDGYRNEWDSILQASGTADGFGRKHKDTVERNIVSYLFFDHENPSSVFSCLLQARENARIVRTALTSPVWDALNSAYQEMKEYQRRPRSEMDISEMTEWTTRQTALVQGAMNATMLRNDGYDFLNLGYNIERADNTARLLDVKYYVLLPDAGYVGSGLDNYQWTVILRAMQMHRAFHWAYGGEATAAKILDMLVLNRQCPRSIVSSVQGINDHLDRLARGYGRSTEAQSRARMLLAELMEIRVGNILEEGLHEFLERCMRDMADLGSTVHSCYLRGSAL